MFSARISLFDLEQLCRRVSTALTSGIELRKAFQREAEGRSPRAVRRHMDQVYQAVARGESVTAAVAATGSYFPRLFHEMVSLGDATGHLAETLRALAEHYELQLKLRRQFVQSITWPLVQLFAALGVVGLLIWLLGVFQDGVPKKDRLDPLGLGLMGTHGVLVYVSVLAVIAVVLVVVYQATRRGVFWARPLQRGLFLVPVIGNTFETLALARFAWSLELTYGSGMDVLKAIPMSLRSTQNAHYTDHIDSVTLRVRKGQEITEALAATGAFRTDFLDAVEVGEKSGRLSETLANLSEQYNDRAQRALAALATVAGFAVWAVVAALITIVIFRLASFYFGMLDKVM
ncbi:MAG: type II secretion system F family protein [Planctomycetes bacterium]|nr:type II secretion system F family protein [Planctomycetota bacterium]